jgi:hypothetical protein
MDTLFILAGVLGVGDILLLRVWARERRLRRKAETHANDAIREKYKLLDVITRRASPAIRPGRPADVFRHAPPVLIREAIAELQTRQAADTGGVA